MTTRIHPTAVVESGAQLGEDVEIGAFAYVGPEVTLGDGTILHHHSSVDGLTTIGEACEIFPYACLGQKTQDLKFKGGRPGVRIGDHNVFREFVTVHAATNDGDFTVVGSNNHFLAYSHIAHDCVMGDHIISSNNGTFAGHVVVEDYAIIGGLTAIHQFCRIGTRAMLGGCCKVIQDVPPYLIADGNPAVIRSFNKVGLERAGFSSAQMNRVKFAFKTFYRDGLNRAQAIEKLETHSEAMEPEIRSFLDFAQKSERGFTPGLNR